MRILFACAGALACFACGPDGRSGETTDAPPGVDGTDGSGSNGEMSRVYAHSGNTLYLLDTVTLQPVQIGVMAGLGTQSLTDLAVDKDNKMVGITLDKLYRIDPATAEVTLLKDLSQSARNLTSLSYIPSNLNDPASADILVSANSFGDVFEIDPATGDATKLGNYGMVAAGQVVSSGDLIGVRGLGIYATVDIGTGNDYLAKIDPATWKATPLGTGTGYDKIFGLAFWGDTIYGFIDMGTGAGKIIKIDPNTGAGTELSANGVRWYGAAVTTDAPVIL